MLSIIIPTWNASQELAATLDYLGGSIVLPEMPPWEVVAADGGSMDGTVDLAMSRGGRVVSAPRGRGTQLMAGAAAAQGDWLLFLHADTRPGPGWAKAVARFMADPENADGRAAYFRFALDDPGSKARRLECAVAWRCRALGLPYGDQGLLLSRALYRAVGGFRPLPLMEDVDLVRRIGRRRLVALDVPAVTSAARWRQDGWGRRSARNLLCLSLYFLGVPPHLIAKLYA